MSGLLAVFRRDGAPVDPAVVDAIAARLAHRGPDGRRVEVAGSLALGHLHRWMSEEEVGEEQPLRYPESSLHLAFDGRLDNRQEIIQALGLPSAAAREATDAALVLAAFERWGEDCLDRLLGPMALIVYDAAARRLILARDPVGNRGLYYFLSPRLLVAASEPFAVAAHPEIGGTLDEVRIAQFFAARLSDHRTFFTEVSAVPPGQALVVTAESVQRRRFGDFVLDREAAGGSLEDNGERFREVLGESVRCRLRGRYEPSLMLSGGLDSTSIAALCKREEIRLRTLTWAFDAFPGCDERSFVELLIGHGGGSQSLRPLPVAGDEAWPLADLDRWPLNPNTPEENAYRGLHDRSYEAARGAGSQVILNGMFGDQLFLGTESWLLDLLRGGALAPALGGSLAEVRAKGVLAHLRGSIASPLRHRLRSGAGRRATGAPSWMTPLACSLLPALVHQERAFPRLSQYDAVLGPINAHGISMEGWHLHHQGVEVRFPYRDRRVIELALSLPTAHLFTPEKRRPVVREAMQGLLPDEIRLRQSKTSLAPLFRKGIEDERRDFVVELLERPGHQWDRYVDRSWLLSSELGAEPWSEARLLVLWFSICCELWLSRRGA